GEDQAHGPHLTVSGFSVSAFGAVICWSLDNHERFPEFCAKSQNGFVGQRFVSSPARPTKQCQGSTNDFSHLQPWFIGRMRFIGLPRARSRRQATAATDAESALITFLWWITASLSGYGVNQGHSTADLHESGNFSGRPCVVPHLSKGWQSWAVTTSLLAKNLKSKACEPRPPRMRASSPPRRVTKPARNWSKIVAPCPNSAAIAARF